MLGKMLSELNLNQIVVGLRIISVGFSGKKGTIVKVVPDKTLPPYTTCATIRWDGEKEGEEKSYIYDNDSCLFTLEDDFHNLIIAKV